MYSCETKRLFLSSEARADGIVRGNGARRHSRRVLRRLALVHFGGRRLLLVVVFACSVRLLPATATASVARRRARRRRRWPLACLCGDRSGRWSRGRVRFVQWVFLRRLQDGDGRGNGRFGRLVLDLRRVPFEVLILRLGQLGVVENTFIVPMQREPRACRCEVREGRESRSLQGAQVLDHLVEGEVRRNARLVETLPKEKIEDPLG